MQANNKRGSIVVLALILVVSAVILGVLVYKSGFLNSSKSAGIGNPQTEATDSGVVDRSNDISDVSSDDEVGSIEKDLNNTNLDSLDDEVMGAKTEAQGL